MLDARPRPIAGAFIRRHVGVVDGPLGDSRVTVVSCRRARVSRYSRKFTSNLKCVSSTAGAVEFLPNRWCTSVFVAVLFGLHRAGVDPLGCQHPVAIAIVWSARQ